MATILHHLHPSPLSLSPPSSSFLHHSNKFIHLTSPSFPSITLHSIFTVYSKKKNPWLDPFDNGGDPENVFPSPFPDGKQEEDPRPPENPENEFGFLKFPPGYNPEVASLAFKIRGDVRRCCCMISGGVYENLLFFPLIQQIKDRYPGVDVDIITTARGKQTYEINKNVRWTTIYDPDNLNPEPAEYVDMIGVMKNRYYDLVLSTKLAGWGHAAFLFMSSSRDRVSYVYPNVNRAGSGLFLTEILIPPHLNLSEGGYHMYNQMVQWIGRPAKNVPTEPIQPLHVSISKKLRAYMADLYRKAGLEKGKFIVIHGIQSDSVASMQSKGDKDSSLPIQFWAEIAKEISGLKPVFVIPHEREREDLEELVGEEANIMFITTPGKLAALIEDSAGVICTNTAAVQLALARNKPCVAMFCSEEKAKLFVPTTEGKNCIIISSKTGKLIDIDLEATKSAAKTLDRVPILV